jgi:hypothetical protein
MRSIKVPLGASLASKWSCLSQRGVSRFLFPSFEGGKGLAAPERRYGPAGGITLGGIIVIVGIVVMIVSSFWIGLIIALIGLVAFGGFARGRWY